MQFSCLTNNNDVTSSDDVKGTGFCLLGVLQNTSMDRITIIQRKQVFETLIGKINI